MELKRRFSFRNCFVFIYFVCFAVFLIVGFQPAEASNYEIISELSIPSIELTSDVVKVELKDHELATPDYLVGAFSRAENKTLLFGHSSTVFEDLQNVSIGDEIVYDYTSYIVDSIEVPKKEDIFMNDILSAAEQKTIVLMTCAGDNLPNMDSTHRLIITALAQ